MRTLETLTLALVDSKAQLRRAYVVLCMIGHFYIHGSAGLQVEHLSTSSTPNDSPIIPTPLVIPWLLVSDALGVKPVLSYASQILWNCTLPPSPSAPLPHDLQVLDTFTGHASELAFDISPARVEYEGSAILREIFSTFYTTFRLPDLPTCIRDMTTHLRIIATALKAMGSHLLTLKRDCNPTHFYHTLRPWIAGSGPKGWTYDLGHSAQKTLVLGGSTAGSSALLQALDAFLGVEVGEGSRTFRKSMQAYMPRGHREFVQMLEGLRGGDVVAGEVWKQVGGVEGEDGAPLRGFVKSMCEWASREDRDGEERREARELGQAYNDVLRALKGFRDEHFRIVSLFVINQASKAQKMERADTEKVDAPLKGTGGSDLAKLLRGHRDSSQNALLDLEPLG